MVEFLRTIFPPNPHLGTYIYIYIYIYVYTGWPRKNATTLIVNFKDIVNKTNLVFYFTG